MAGGVSTRRRSNSTGDATAKPTTTTAAAEPNAFAPATRPNRRSRGLPTLKINATPDPSPSSSSSSGPARAVVRTPRATSRVRTPASSGNYVESLKALSPEGKSIALSIKVGGKLFTNGDGISDAEIVPSLPLGHDGNTFFCQECGEVGDVVCCDGCPRVYHGKCVPAGPSRDSLDQDNWYCPSCFTTKAKSGMIRTCFECNETGNNLKQCESCEGWIHVPKCPGDDDDDDDDLSDDSDDDSPRKVALQQRIFQAQQGRVLCKICRVETLEHERVKQESNSTEKQEDDEEDNIDDDDDDKVNEDDGDLSSIDDACPQDNATDAASPSSSTTGSPPKPGENRTKKSSPDAPGLTRKRGRLSLPSSKVKDNMEMIHEITATASPPLPRSKKIKLGHEKKQSKNKSRPSRSSQKVEDDTNLNAASEILKHSLGYPKAIPAFFYFLNEHRQKLERHLARKHRTFIRLPKGLDRNELIAQEGAAWWSKLKEAEIRRYMEISMKDYEAKIMEWKEEKTIRDMFMEHDNVDDEYDVSFEDEVLTYENHQRLYLGTNVGSKSYKPDPESLSTQNRVLLELLQDIRFHPMPMMQVSRTEAEYGQMDFERVTIPYFDVHGPFSTSVGDECMGCTRGWAHFCPVLKRRVPAVEYRARLQPALSSLMATRVGLGLRPKLLPDPKIPDNPTDFSTWTRPDAKDLRTLPMEATETLSDPSTRVDDVVQFIEEIHAMKLPEPPRPDFPNRLDVSSKGGDPTCRGSGGAMKRSFDTMGGEGSKSATLMKCGRCRTVIRTDTGCVQCRRAQLVLNLSKRPPPGQNDSLSADVTSVLSGTLPATSNYPCLQVQTQMCGRVSIKEGVVECHNDPDSQVAHGILRQRWTPFAVLPPTTVLSPTPKSKLQHRPPIIEDCSSEDNSDKAARTEHVVPGEVSGEKNSLGDSSDQGDDASLSSKGSKIDFSRDVDEKDNSLTLEQSQSGVDASAKRLRSARIAAGTTTVSKEDPLKEELRQELQSRFKEEADELQKKCLGRACCGILFALMRRDPLRLFATPVTAEGYSTIVTNPIDFSMIREQVLEDKYSSLGAFASDCRLLCTNAFAYNPPGSIYWKCAKELHEVLAVMQKRAQQWMTAVKDAHATAWRRTRKEKETTGIDNGDAPDIEVDDPFGDLRKNWPDAVDVLDDAEWLRRQVEADFMRSRENEIAYYAALAVRRAAAGAEAAMTPYPDSGGMYNVVPRRSHIDDEGLRRSIDERVSGITHPVELKDLPGWREDSIMRILRRAQTRRLDGMSTTNVGCARCDGTPGEVKNQSKTSQLSRLTKYRVKRNEQIRIDPSRANLSTGMSSQTTRARLQGVLAELVNEKDLNTKAQVANQVAVTVRGSGIHGWGLYADQYFKKGDVVAEYIGEYVSLAVTEAREKMYREHRIQDYQFRVDDALVIDATMRGGHGRYINHNCNPNCVAKIIPGAPPNEHLKRVLIIAQRKIEPREELTYDYQFPLELDLNARIPCNCTSDLCRGFMNWDLPEKGSATQSFRTQKRGANMRDRIRRLGRPLKGERGGDVDDDDDGDDSG